MLQPRGQSTGSEHGTCNQGLPWPLPGEGRAAPEDSGNREALTEPGSSWAPGCCVPGPRCTHRTRCPAPAGTQWPERPGPACQTSPAPCPPPTPVSCVQDTARDVLQTGSRRQTHCSIRRNIQEFSSTCRICLYVFLKYSWASLPSLPTVTGVCCLEAGEQVKRPLTGASRFRVLTGGSPRTTTSGENPSPVLLQWVPHRDTQSSLSDPTRHPPPQHTILPSKCWPLTQISEV